MKSSDQDILTSCNMEDNRTQSDTEAFNRLVHSYAPMLARYVRCRVTNPSDAEDVLQETFVAIWLGFRQLRDSARIQSWLLHVAQNRCRDYFRAQQRQEIPLEADTLQDYSSRFGLHQYRQTKMLTNVIQALEAAPQAARETARRFYLEGLTIAEIAEATQSPPGTVKRRLFQARHAARTFLGVPRQTLQSRTENTTMPAQNYVTTQNAAENLPDFPQIRPEIKITEIDEPPFTVDCQELRSWAIIPRLGAQASSADYTLPGWKLSEVSTMQVLREAQIHDVDSVEIVVNVWHPESGWQRPGTIYARLTDTKAEFLAVHLPHEEFTQIETFLDSTFTANWGTLERVISDQGVFRHSPDSLLELCDASPRSDGTGIGFGVVRLEINGKFFTCLRVVEAFRNEDLAESKDYLTVSYLTPQGHTILVRRYCHPAFAEVAQFPAILDEAERLVINGMTLVHWYDTITDKAL